MIKRKPMLLSATLMSNNQHLTAIFLYLLKDVDKVS